ncbi:hypothetical protein GCM10023345_11670 [Acinetobacter kookii]|uniref:Uncharacterized protein n=1 Tax=Acinetobacter kookii TaxID=1226327 RepID=A0A1G6GYC5_9GAMM|nr:hypothetical protein SAMN05421732_101491 [Acinetobacter kookii]
MLFFDAFLSSNSFYKPGHVQQLQYIYVLTITKNIVKLIIVKLIFIVMFLNHSGLFNEIIYA